MRITNLLPAACIAVGVTGMCNVTWAFAQQGDIYQTSAGPVEAQVVAEALNFPWSMAFLPDGRMLVTERVGNLRVVGMDGAISDPIDGVPDVWVNGQGGLLDVALAEDFASSGEIYFSFSEPGEGGAGTAVMAAKLVLEGNGGILRDQKTIFRMNHFTSKGQHFGSRIAVADDGNLWITLGERGEGTRAQDPFDLAGGVVRIAPDGSIPTNNPFGDGEKGNPAFWSIGHRNPQGATLREDGSLWIIEHGAQGGDEVNKPQSGGNYGWPVIAYGEHYGGGQIGEGHDALGYEQPVYYWDPSIAPSGLDFYAGDMFPEWQGDLLVGALKFQLLVRLDMEGDKVVDEERLFESAFGRIRDVRVGPEGAIYLATDDANGQIIRIVAAD